MKNDLDTLIRARNLDAIMVSGKVLGNPPLVYMLNGACLTQAIIIKKPDEAASLIVSPMEREEALCSGLRIVLNSRYNYRECLKVAQGDPLSASIEFYRRIFADLEIHGRVGVYGHLDQGYAYAFLTALDAALADIEIVGEIGTDLMTQARATKDHIETERIREVGQRTCAIVDQTLAHLRSHAIDENEILRKPDGTILTVDDMHTTISQLIAMQGLEDPVGFIFATGADAGIPHSRGTGSALIRLGQTIVFDIFPREAGGGYFFDLTRTFCMGYAPPAAAKLYLDVLDCLRHIQSIIRCGHTTAEYQRAACAFFTQRGHATIEQNPATLDGYVHGLGHGVGLAIHESPGFEDTPSNTLRLAPGHIFTLEPGLYYPDLGMGCRIEDILWVDEDGVMQNLTQYPYELVVPI
ncbi:MAG: aminopeptidase P family protein [Anaerolineales bacterium]|nr:MAG: aminopeptidase P family protein [Anaerolineales bacterium]